MDGIDVHHKVVGDQEPTFLLFHHFWGNVLTWRKVMPDLAELGRVVAFDRPGFGFTERAPRERWNGRNPYTRAWSADAALQLLDHVGAERAVLVGSSAGGTSAIETYLRAPERVAGMVLVSPAISGDVGAPAALRQVLNRDAIAAVAPSFIERFAGEIDAERVAGSWFDPSRLEPADLDAYRRVLDVEGWARGYFEVMTAEAPPSLRGMLPRIDVPTLVVTGDSDRTIAPTWSRRTASAIPGARFEVLPRCGHTPQEERPEALVDAVRRFVRDASL